VSWKDLLPAAAMLLPTVILVVGALVRLVVQAFG
jgi:hypothetical protein